MRMVRFPNGSSVPALGLGTWFMGENASRRGQEVRALKAGIDLGMTLIDTAEMYADGGAEEVVGEALRDCRDEVFLVSKVLPYNASRSGVAAACEASLQRMGTDRIDLYLLHWPGPHPLEETLAGFEDLREAGKIGAFGVSNFDVSEMEAWEQVAGEGGCQTDQVLYNLTRRGIEWDLMPWSRERKMPLMAYSPLEQGRLSGEEVLDDLGRKYGLTASQIALVWVLRDPDVIAIPKASRLEHVSQNRACLDFELEQEDLELLDQVFPPPREKRGLEIL